jgi:hypothetical protein
MTALIAWLLAFNWILKRDTYALVARYTAHKTPTEEERRVLNLEMRYVCHFVPPPRFHVYARS